MKPEFLNDSKLSVGCGRTGSSTSTSFIPVTSLLFSLLKVTFSLVCYFRTTYLWITAISLLALSRWQIFYEKLYAVACLCRAPPKRHDRMWHSPLFTSRFAIRIRMMIIKSSYMKMLQMLWWVYRL